MPISINKDWYTTCTFKIGATIIRNYLTIKVIKMHPQWMINKEKILMTLYQGFVNYFKDNFK